MGRLGAALALLTLLSAPRAALAQPDTREELQDDIEEIARELVKHVPFKDLARSSLKATQRAVALGPFVGGTGVYGTDSGEATGAISFGLSLSTFKVSLIPDREALQRILLNRLKERLLREVERKRAGDRSVPKPTAEDLEQLAKELWEDVLDEYLRGHRAKLFEKPRFHLHAEGAYLLDSGGFETRMTAALGIGPVSFGPTTAARFDDGASFLVGPELIVKMLPTKGLRSPVIDLFARWDFAFGELDGSLISAGARVALDII
ncbi:MAG: hypothetical protein Tsb0020_05540 [Haliangiales bacterium]